MFTEETLLFPLIDAPEQFRDLKDPCPVFDGSQWHIFGSGGSTRTESWLIYHATAPYLEGPWTEQTAIDLGLQGSGVAAPGVLFSNGLFRMFIQTEFMKPDGKVEYLTSVDGSTWNHVSTALHAIPDGPEHGIYDPHPAIINGEYYLAYSAMAEGWPPKPDIYLAKSAAPGSWDGPWLRMGKILDHADIAIHHNQRDHAEYEWGIEGAQLIQLPNGRVLLNATSFLPTGARGSRQRVFFAVAENVMGPYVTVGPVIEPPCFGENGHSTVLIEGDGLFLFYQARLETTDNCWRYGLATTSTQRFDAPAALTAAVS